MSKNVRAQPGGASQLLMEKSKQDRTKTNSAHMIGGLDDVMGYTAEEMFRYILNCITRPLALVMQRQGYTKDHLKLYHHKATC